MTMRTTGLRRFETPLAILLVSLSLLANLCFLIVVAELVPWGGLARTDTMPPWFVATMATLAIGTVVTGAVAVRGAAWTGSAGLAALLLGVWTLVAGRLAASYAYALQPSLLPRSVKASLPYTLSFVYGWEFLIVPGTVLVLIGAATARRPQIRPLLSRISRRWIIAGVLGVVVVQGWTGILSRIGRILMVLWANPVRILPLRYTLVSDLPTGVGAWLVAHSVPLFGAFPVGDVLAIAGVILAGRWLRDVRGELRLAVLTGFIGVIIILISPRWGFASIGGPGTNLATWGVLDATVAWTELRIQWAAGSGGSSSVLIVPWVPAIGANLVVIGTIWTLATRIQGRWEFPRTLWWVLNRSGPDREPP